MAANFKYFPWCHAIFAALIVSMITHGIHAQQPQNLTGWALTFSDEFDGQAVDTEKWEVLNLKDSHNDEKQYYLPEQASIVDGVLRLTATHETHDGKDYRSARLESWFTQAYGRFEARAKIPTTKGLWPALWLLPRNVRWPLGGEIDIMEHGGSKPQQVVHAFHYADEAGKHDYVHHAYTTEQADGDPVQFPDEFHVYSVIWTPTEMVFYVDGVESYRVDKQQVPVPDTPMSIILNSAVGGWFDGDPDETTVFPQHFDIDYVRVYQRVDGPRNSGRNSAGAKRR